MCVHKAIKDCKNRVDITNNFFVKRDLCCPMPFDDIRQHDQLKKTFKSKNYIKHLTYPVLFAILLYIVRSKA